MSEEFSPTAVVLYCSQSSWGNEKNPFAKQAHYVILNGEPDDPSDPRAQYDWRRDGKIIQVRPESEKGTRVPENGMNDIAIQVCLIGAPLLQPRGLLANVAYIARPDGHKMLSPYTERQMMALFHLLTDICTRRDIWPNTRAPVSSLVLARRKTVWAVTQRGFHVPHQTHDCQLYMPRIQDVVTGYRIDNHIPPLPGARTKEV